MFDEDEMPNKPVAITMMMHDDCGREIHIRQEYEDGTTWVRIAYQFYCFLVAQGYVLEKEDVGASDDDL